MADSNTTVTVLLETIQQLAYELHPHKARYLPVTLDSTLERELGFDSLGRMELLVRLEQAFHARLSEQLVATADTPRDVLRALQDASAFPDPRQTTQRTHHTLVQADSLPTHARTLIEVLDWHVQMHPQHPHIYLADDAGAEETITYMALAEGATAVAAGLQTRGIEPGQVVAIMLPTSRGFLESFLGILLAGGIPVPIYPPLRRAQLEDHMRRQASILANARTIMLITVPEAKPVARLMQAQIVGLRSIVTVPELMTERHFYTRPAVQGQDIAFVQYTSGSTGTPKGVVLTHANLLANIHAMHTAVQTTPADVFVSWLPLYHDMGLIGAWLGSLYCAYSLVLMSPLAFLARPERWLWAIHRHRGTISGAPNFAYELCVQKLTDSDLEGLDLSTWRLAFNGAEPVSVETLERFSTRFARYGFHSEAMTPVYGLAENALGLAFPPLGRGPRLDRIKREPFWHTGQAVPAAPDDAHAVSFVSCGQPLPGHQIRVVDALGHEVAERQQGRLEFCGPSSTSGYLHNPDATSQLFRGTWLDSGDLAYIAAGEVYLTGRAKDMIIRAGRNLYPHELEEAIGQLPHIRKGCVAVFGSPDPVAKTERLIVLAETRQTAPQEQAVLRQQIDALTVDLLGMPPDDVILARPHTVLKTSSGKIRRAACRHLYEQGRLGTRPATVWWQVVRLLAASIVPQIRRVKHLAANVGYTAYAWTLFGTLGMVAWGMIMLLPKRSWRQTAVRILAQWGLRLAGIPLRVRGLAHLPQHPPYVLAANHASYLDAFVLQAVFAGDLRYVAKRELAEYWFIRQPLQRLGVAFVERFDVQRGIEDTARVVKVVQEGHSVMFFPEGTFGREPGLRPFRPGAFVVAAQAGAPVVPLVLHGTRSILRANQWVLRRGAIHLTLLPPMTPTGTDWPAAITLRDAVRAQILHDCGEPDLGAEPPPLLLRTPPRG